MFKSKANAISKNLKLTHTPSTILKPINQIMRGMLKECGGRDCGGVEGHEKCA